MRQIAYWLNSLKWFAIRVRNKLAGNRWAPKGKKYAGRELLANQQGNDFIAEGIKSGKPFMAARFGSIELLTVSDGYAMDIGAGKSISALNLRCLAINSGFFPEEATEAKKFADLMIECMPEVDLLGVWYNPHEDYFLKHKMPDAKITYIRGLDAYLAKNPWTKHLKGKKVVVVHPFEKSILSQYNNREKLFEDKDVLPEFELRVVKAVVTFATETDGRFKDWFEALDYMYNEIMKEDFDVAILGCGAYGFPLAARIKKAGKQAIHLGGATQILFGIKGKKWDNEKEGRELYNEFWVRPSEEETPKASNRVEKGCYW